jgi:hypothetical protein
MSDQDSTESDRAELSRVVQLIYGVAPSQAIAVAAKLGIADRLKEQYARRGERTAE